MRALPILLALLLFMAAAPSTRAQAVDPTPEQYREDALAIEALVNREYAYLDRFPGGVMPMSDVLRRQAGAVTDGRSLLAYAERALFALADHHAITGSAFADSWGLVPSYADLWIVMDGGDYRIDAVRDGSPAQARGVAAGQRLTAVEDHPVEAAVAAFWADLGLDVTDERRAFAARVLAAGRRDRPRTLTVRGDDGPERRLVLPNLYEARPSRPPVETRREGDSLVIVVNDSLGDMATVAAFDAAMATAAPGQSIVLDLTDTASGGNTIVARAIMGWFVDAAAPYQVHNRPSEERRTGVPRQWVEQVLPRPGKRHDGPLTVRVGRWTGSMGEGLAIGLDALGARVEGGAMAGLLGAIEDFRLPHSSLVLKLPTERLYAVDGRPRETFVPAP